MIRWTVGERGERQETKGETDHGSWRQTLYLPYLSPGHIHITDMLLQLLMRIFPDVDSVIELGRWMRVRMRTG